MRKGKLSYLLGGEARMERKKHSITDEQVSHVASMASMPYSGPSMTYSGPSMASPVVPFEASYFASEMAKPEIIKSTMARSMESHVLVAAQRSLDRREDANEAAARIAGAMREGYGGWWHCIIGDSCYSYSIYDVEGCFISLKMDGKWILLFKSRS
ncbi:unnamed protein product [Darwinula stevensoni]|uniref:Dynein light chain n=1 Tax=Darwinula stevensoni TaxID=69355 RepID=A0A7R9FQ30_9CRUS|nr:unnamed protein product [Darwinula stevensoni]CAG0898698.1 unnamed protein product [Darwinula stevensoni]